MANPLPDWLQVALQCVGGGGSIIFLGYLAAKQAFGLIEKRKDLAEIDAARIKSLRESFEDDKLLREKQKANFDGQVATLTEELERHKADLDVTGEALAFFVGRAEVTNLVVLTLLETVNDRIAHTWNEALNHYERALTPLLIEHQFTNENLQKTIDRVFKEPRTEMIPYGPQYEIFLQINRQLHPLIVLISMLQVHGQMIVDALDYYSKHPDKEYIKILEKASASASKAKLPFTKEHAAESLLKRVHQVFAKASDAKLDIAKPPDAA